MYRSSKVSEALAIQPVANDIMNECEAAEYLGVCDKTLRKLRKTSSIPHARVGERIVYVRTKLLVWLEAGGTAQQETEV